MLKKYQYIYLNLKNYQVDYFSIYNIFYMCDEFMVKMIIIMCNLLVIDIIALLFKTLPLFYIQVIVLQNDCYTDSIIEEYLVLKNNKKIYYENENF